MTHSARSWGMQRPSLALEPLESRELLTLFGNLVFPADNPWNQRIDNAPVAANSATLVASIGLTAGLKADFGANLWEGAYIGIPWNVVSGSQAKISVIVDAYPNESDLIPIPIPPGAVIEGDPRPGEENTGDRHLLVYDRDNHILYEAFNTHRPAETSDGQWHADSIAFWDLNTNYFRPPGWTSADAAGLPIVPGLVRPDEVLEKGRIDHPLRVTVPRSRNQYVFPASHHAGSNNPALPRMGERFRLRQDFNIAGFSPANQIILQAMKEYGLIVADNGSPWYVSGLPSSLWNDDDLQNLRRVRGSDFEAVDLTPRLAGLSQSEGSSAGGFQITVDGLNFGGAAGQMQVFFGTAAASLVSVKSDSQVTVTVPAHPAGTVQVTVRSPHGTIIGGEFTFVDEGPQPGRFQFGARTFRVGEADALALVTVLRTGGSTGTVSVRYATGGGTATAGSDYVAGSNVLTFGPGETSKTIEVALRDDTAVEGRETVRLTLSNPTGGATLGTVRSATLVVRDNDGTTPARFVAQVYQDLLGRPPDEAGLRVWVEQLGQGTRAQDVVLAIVASSESHARTVRMAYRDYLGRDPEDTGLAAWRSFLDQGGTEEQLRLALLGSDEFYSRNGSTSDRFLEGLYDLVLGRPLDPAGGQAWLAALRQGTPRHEVARTVLGSDENLRQEVDGLFENLLCRPADPAGLEAFLAALRRRTPSEVILGVMAGSEEYMNSCR